MKKLIAMMLAVIFASGIWLQAKDSKQHKVNSVAVTSMAREYSLVKGFHVISLGGLVLKLARLIANAAAEGEESKTILALTDDLKRVVVVEYEDAEAKKKEVFIRKVSRILDDAEKLVEVKRDGTTLNIYGISADDGARVEDVIVYVPEECALICLFGSISTQKIMNLLEMKNGGF